MYILNKNNNNNNKSFPLEKKKQITITNTKVKVIEYKTLVKLNYHCAHSCCKHANFD